MGAGFSWFLVQKDTMLLNEKLCLRTREVEAGFGEKLIKTLSLVFFGYADRKGITSVAILREVGHSTPAPNSKHQIPNESQFPKPEIPNKIIPVIQN
jgi:hypothetical protein